MAPRNRAVTKRQPIGADTNKAIALYFQSKAERTDIKHNPEWDVVVGEPLIELMRVRRELLAADAELRLKREEYRSRRHDADINWQLMRDKHALLRRSFFSFNDFVKENREKRERAQRKIKDEHQRQKIRKAEIVELEKSLEYMEKVRDKMKNYVKEYKPFQDYLESVLATKEFTSINAIFNRYETLVAARAALVVSQDDSLRKLEDTSIQLQRIKEDKSQSLMDLNSRLAQLHSRHERANSRAVQWEMIVSRIKDVAMRKELEETQVRACIWNLYRQICRRKDLPVELKRDDLEQQLYQVKMTIVGLTKIVRAAKRKAAHEEHEKRMKEQENDIVEFQAYEATQRETKSSLRSSLDRFVA